MKMIIYYCNILDSFVHFVTYIVLCLFQGKEIIEFYLKELEDDGITHMPRWTPSPQASALPRPTSLYTSLSVLPALPMSPTVSTPVPADTKDSTSQDAKPDSTVLQTDSLAEMLAGTPEGLAQTQLFHMILNM